VKMKDLVGRSCKIAVSVSGKDLFYTVKEVTEVTATHISFIDKFNKHYTYRWANVVEVDQG
jgi:hypothetical protein